MLHLYVHFQVKVHRDIWLVNVALNKILDDFLNIFNHFSEAVRQ